MKGAIIYFSGTGNTEFAAKLFKVTFEEKGIECSIIDISKKRNLSVDYDFYIFGGPIYNNAFPKFFSDWIKNKLKNGSGEKSIVFSTQWENHSKGPSELSKILKDKGYEVLIQDFIFMPNNYYLFSGNRSTEGETARLKEKAKEKIDKIVEKFLKDEKYTIETTLEGSIGRETSNKALYNLEKSWAQNYLTVDYGLCVKCGKCAKNCPSGNISMKEDITFKDKCILCQKCIHRCPVNAFLYNGKPIDQYKI